MSERTEKADASDVHVGSQIRERRQQLKMSQALLAEKSGVTFQQIQKYERGHNRVSASRLHKISRALGVSVAYFFEGLEGQGETQIESDAREARDELREMLGYSSARHVIRSYIRNPFARRALNAVAYAMMAGGQQPEEGEASAP